MKINQPQAAMYVRVSTEMTKEDSEIQYQRLRLALKKQEHAEKERKHGTRRHK